MLHIESVWPTNTRVHAWKGQDEGDGIHLKLQFESECSIRLGLGFGFGLVFCRGHLAQPQAPLAHGPILRGCIERPFMARYRPHHPEVTTEDVDTLPMR